jgi:hypothetical protein
MVSVCYQVQNVNVLDNHTGLSYAGHQTRETIIIYEQLNC